MGAADQEESEQVQVERVKWQTLFVIPTSIIGRFDKFDDYWVELHPGYGCWVISSSNIHPKTMDRFPPEAPTLKRAKRIARDILLREEKRLAKKAKKRAKK